MADFQTVAKVSEIDPGDMKLVGLAGEGVVVANVDGSYFAFGNEWAIMHLTTPIERCSQVHVK